MRNSFDLSYLSIAKYPEFKFTNSLNLTLDFSLHLVSLKMTNSNKFNIGQYFKNTEFIKFTNLNSNLII